MMNYTVLEFEELDSTNDFLKENHSYFPHMTWIRTHFQTKGRGQFDRIWESKPKENLLFSILIKELKMNQIPNLKEIVLKSLKNFFADYKIYPEFKEPNDLYVNDQKICGILIETRNQETEIDYAIIGIGINVNQTHFSFREATSMKNLKHQHYDLDLLFKSFIKGFNELYKKI